MNAEALEFDDGSFDLIVGNGIFYHLDLERAFSEIHRVLVPAGVGSSWSLSATTRWSTSTDG